MERVKHIEAINHPVFSRQAESFSEIVVTGIDVTERKRAEQALRESEAKFRDYAETASDWFWEIGPDYKFTLLTENAFGSDAGRSRSARRAGITPSTLKRNRRSGGLFRQPRFTQTVPRLRISRDGRQRLSDVREGQRQAGV